MSEIEGRRAIKAYFHSSFSPEISACEVAIPEIKSEALESPTTADAFAEELFWGWKCEHSLRFAWTLPSGQT